MQYGLRRGWTITAPGLLCATMIAAMLMHVLTVRCRTKRFVGTATSSTHAILAEVCRVGGAHGHEKVPTVGQVEVSGFWPDKSIHPVFVVSIRNCGPRW